MLSIKELYPRESRVHMLNKLLIVLLMSITLSASPAEDFFKDINTTYSKKSYQNIFENLDALTISSFEKNSTQKMIKEDFENLLANYLNNKDIFSTSSLKKLTEENVGKPRLRMFISASLVYMKYLDKKGKTKDAENIMRRNLINFNSLMTKSDDMVDYIWGLVLYKRTFSYMESSLQNMTGILEEYPPPNESIYFEKMNGVRDNILKLTSEMNDIDNIEKDNYDDSNYKRLMSQVRSSANEYTKIYFNKMETAIKSDSSEAFDNFYEDIEKEEVKSMSLWSQIKLIFHLIMAQLFQTVFGYNIFHDYLADYAGKVVAISSFPQFSNIYLTHKKVVRQYNVVIESKTHD